MYKVITAFKDRDGKMYQVDDEYNNEDLKRLEVLSTDQNKYGYPFIQKVKKNRKKEEE